MVELSEARKNNTSNTVLSITILALMLFVSCACSADSPDKSVETAKNGSTVGEKKNPDENRDENRNVPAPVSDRTWVGHAWSGFERNENFEVAANNNQSRPLEFSVCEMSDFKSFFERFSENIDFQLSTARFPLKLTSRIPSWNISSPSLDINDDTVIEKIEYLTLPEHSRGIQLFPTRKQREKEGLKFTCSIEDSAAIVHLQKEDTGVSMNFVFMWDQCWVLSEIVDYSM